MICTEGWIDQGCIRGSHSAKPLVERVLENFGYGHPSKP